MTIQIKQIILENLNFFDTVDGQPAVNKAYLDAANYIQNSPEDERNAINQALDQGNRNLATGKPDYYNKMKIGSFYSEQPLDQARRIQSYESANNVQNYANSLSQSPKQPLLSDNTKENIRMLGAGGIGAGLAFGLANRFNRRR